MSAITGFELILDPTHMTFWNGIPETPMDLDGSYEVYEISPAQERLLLEDFADAINTLCGSWVDLGDPDYFDAGKRCPLLRNWLVDRLERPCDDGLARAYNKLLEFSSRAIELGTGVVVTL